MSDLLKFTRTSLTGGGATAVDGISATALVGEEICWATVSDKVHTYRMNATSGAAADGINIIIPVVGTVGNKRWILESINVAAGYVYVDHIAEGTAAHGVNIDGVLLKDGDVSGTGTFTAATASTAIADNTSTTQIATTAFAKSQDAVLAREPDQGVALTVAASGSSGITVADNDNIDFGTGNFALVWKGSLPDWTPSENKLIAYKYNGTNLGYAVYLLSNGTFFVYLNASENTGAITNTFVDGSTHELVFVFNNGTNIKIYADGVLFDTISISAYASLNNTIALEISGGIGTRTAGTVHHAYTLNFAPTAAEVLDMYRNGIPESWKYGSQTSIITGTDSTFAGASNWANVDINAYDETTGGVLTITASAANQYCTLPVANATTVSGKKYRLTYTVASLAATWTVKDFGGTVTIGTVSADGTNSIEFTASTTGGLRLVAVANNSSGVFDNFLLYQIGATLALTPDSIRPDRWIDIANANHATYPTAGCTLTRPWSLADLQAAANNAAAAGLTIPVPIGGLYRTNADPSVICVRTA